MSQDKFWEQWGAGSGQAGSSSDKTPSPEGADRSGPVDDDVLAAWLKSLPPDDPLVPPPTALPSTSSSPSDLAALWPPAAPVDPFAGIGEGAMSGGGDWDLAIDPGPSIHAPSAPVAPPAVTPPPAAPVSQPPAPASAVGDFDLNLGNLAGPVPAGNPFAPADTPPPAAVPPPTSPPPSPFGVPPPVASAPPGEAAPPPASGGPAPMTPFGPPIPPVAPPAENLAAAPLRVEVTVGRRTFEQDVRGEALIGRPDATRGIHPEIDLRQDDAVSRRHAKIFLRDGKYVLTDLNSTNGTRHNRQWVQPESEIILSPGDEIEVGELTLIRVLEIPSTHA